LKAHSDFLAECEEYINKLITAFKKEFKIYKKYHNYRIVTRQYFPKGINVRGISDKILAIAVKKINHRPRKCLDYQTPSITWCICNLNS